MFFHSILKSNYLSGFNSVLGLRLYLASNIQRNYTNDSILQKIFHYHEMNVAIWFEKIRTMGTWANELDIILAANILRVNIITVGNYMNGFITNNMQLNLNQVLKHNGYHISQGSTIYIYFHIYHNPSTRMREGNHFAYMHPISYIPNGVMTPQLNSSIINERQYKHHDINLDLHTVSNKKSYTKAEENKKLK